MTNMHLTSSVIKDAYCQSRGLESETTTMPNFPMGLGVSFLRMRDFAPLGTKWLGGGVMRKATAETRAPILTQNTSNDAVPRKEVPFAGRETNI